MKKLITCSLLLAAVASFSTICFASNFDLNASCCFDFDCDIDTIAQHCVEVGQHMDAEYNRLSNYEKQGQEELAAQCLDNIKDWAEDLKPDVNNLVDTYGHEGGYGDLYTSVCAITESSNENLHSFITNFRDVAGLLTDAENN